MISKQEFDRMYVGEKLVVHCDTEEKAREFLSLADDFGYKWVDGSSYKSETNFEVFEKDTCYSIYRGAYGKIWYYERIEYNMVEYTLQEPTKYKQLAKILGVEIGEEFKIKFPSGNISNVTYKIENCRICDSRKSNYDGRFLLSDISVRVLLSYEIVKLPWKPKFDDIYYHIDPMEDSGYCADYWSDDKYDKNMYKRGLVFKTEEEVKEAVKKLGWVAE